MKNSADVQRMIQRFHHSAIFVPFVLSSAPDNHDPGQTIADIGSSGLGLPDRDYYLKPEQRFQEAREKYHTHVANIFRLAGYNDQQAQAAARAKRRGACRHSSLPQIAHPARAAPADQAGDFARHRIGYKAREPAR